MKKALKICGISVIVLLCLPLVLIAGWILWELFCTAANNISGQWHTDSVLNGYSNDSDIEVLDKATFVGNTSGTGNHTEVRTTVLVKVNNRVTLEYWTQGDEYYIYSLSEEMIEYDNTSRRNRDVSNWERELKIPDDITDCYVVEVYGEVPFPDSIMGH